jgi:hypothetical protein
VMPEVRKPRRCFFMMGMTSFVGFCDFDIFGASPSFFPNYFWLTDGACAPPLNAIPLARP